MAKKKAEPKATSPKTKAISKDNAPEVTADPFVKNEFGVIPPQTGQTELAGLGVPSELAGGQLTNKDQAVSNAISLANKTEKNDKTETQGTDTNESPQSTDQDGEKNLGDIAIEPASADSNQPVNSLESLLPSHARLPGEGRAAFWERTRKALRAIGMPRGQGPGTAYEMATRAAEREFPPPVPVIIEELPAAEVEPVAVEPPKPVPEPVSAPVQADQGVSGLGNFPPDWPKLPANAQLQQEIAWVTANRLLVRDGSGVNLSRAMSPPPSYSALSWLETSILFPAKFADISVKATAENDDERELIRREKLAVEEIRSILKEMRDAKG